MIFLNPNWFAGGMPIPAGESKVVHNYENDPTPYINRVRRERDFLREAATFFASDQKRSIR